MKYPENLEKLIEGFRKYPGIGKKTAQRLAFFTINNLCSDDVLAFSEALKESKAKIKHCDICGNITEDDLCSVCTDEKRDKTTIMVVENVKDAIFIDEMNSYHGLYHILNGVIDFSSGIGPSDINTESLFKRLDGVKEVILATSATVEGELTANYLHEILKDQVLTTRLAYGLPVGTDFEYLDDLTLLKAIEGRKKY